MQPASPPSPSAPQGPPSRPGGGGGGFRRTHVVVANSDPTAPQPDGAMPPPGPPPPPRPSATTADVGNGAQQPQLAMAHRHRSGAAAPAALAAAHSPSDSTDSGSYETNGSTGSDSSADARRVQVAKGGGSQKQSQQQQQPSALTAGVVDRAFGVAGAENQSAPVAATGSRTGTSAALVRPTTKEGNDAASMYSMSQSILPADPRDRLYYRPRRHLLQCYVKRKKEGGLLRSLVQLRSYSYHFFLEHTSDFVLGARQRPSKSSTRAEDMTDGVQGRSYEVTKGVSGVLFSINQQQLDKDVRSFVGKLSRRDHGHEMVLYSEGDKQHRREIAAVRLDAMQDGQRRFKVILPAIDEETGYIRPLEGGQVRFLRDGRGTTLYAGGTSMAENGSRGGIEAALQSSSEDEVDDTATANIGTGGGVEAPEFRPVGAVSAAPGSPGAAAPGKKAKWRTHGLLVQEYLRDQHSPNIIVLQNKLPKWDSVLRGYQLDFHGRAAKASEKNFQLVPVQQPDKVVMLLGKQTDDKYAVDFRYPLCGLQAAAIATAMMMIKQL